MAENVVPSTIRRRKSSGRPRAPKGAPLAFLMAHLDHTGSDCLPWPFSRSATGYGTIAYNGKSTTAHRVMCELVHGPGRPDEDTAHSCGNGHLACVNPNHLRWATRRENGTDRTLHGRMPRGEKHGDAKLSEYEAIAIIALTGRLPVREVARLFNISVGVVVKIQNGRIWKHLGA